MSGKIRLGIAGWVFDEWRGEFYPKGLPQKQELAYASEKLGSIEINSTFYSHQKESSFKNWVSQVPDDFVFSVKGHQLVTHLKKLKDVEIPLANVFASGVLALGKHLAPFCWQLPGNLKYDEARVESFLKLLPQTPDELVGLAKKHDERIATPFLETAGVTKIRHAIEVRHESFANETFLSQLRTYNVASVTSDTAEWPRRDVTSDFAYCRLQGAPGADHYEPAELDAWARQLETWSKSGDVFAFFVSTDKLHAPRNARYVMQKLGLADDA